MIDLGNAYLFAMFPDLARELLIEHPLEEVSENPGYPKRCDSRGTALRGSGAYGR